MKAAKSPIQCRLLRDVPPLQAQVGGLHEDDKRLKWFILRRQTRKVFTALVNRRNGQPDLRLDDNVKVVGQMYLDIGNPLARFNISMPLKRYAGVS
jgi:hypothetical protein